jgi:hypothetical protein
MIYKPSPNIATYGLYENVNIIPKWLALPR